MLFFNYIEDFSAHNNCGDFMISAITRTAILYIFVTVGIRLMGKRQIGDMQPNELVVTFLISEIAAIPLQDMNQPVLSGITSIFILVVLEIAFSIVAMKSFRIRKLLNGKSVVIIKNGVIDQKSMQDVRMTVLDLVELLRGQDVFDISQVAYAILEVNGNLSVLLKSQFQNATLKDLDIKSQKEGLMLPVISDGRLIKETLVSLSTDEKSVKSILKKKNSKISDVFLMTLDRYGNYNIINKEDKV